MTVELTGVQIIGFAAFVVGVAPAVFALGRLWQTTSENTRMISQLFQKTASIDEKLVERLDQVEQRLLAKIEENGYKNCPVNHRGDC